MKLLRVRKRDSAGTTEHLPNDLPAQAIPSYPVGTVHRPEDIPVRDAGLEVRRRGVVLLGTHPEAAARNVDGVRPIHYGSSAASLPARLIE